MSVQKFQQSKQVSLMHLQGEKTMKINLGEHITVVGITGTGKTYFSRNALLPIFQRVLVIDTEEYDFEDFPIVKQSSIGQLVKTDYRFAAKVVLSPEDTEEIEDICLTLLKHGHDMVVYIDEITDFSDAHRIPKMLKALIRKARKRKISVVVGTQRPQMLNLDFLANSMHNIYFFMSERDADYISNYEPRIFDNLGAIPYQSYQSIYIGPDRAMMVFAPAEEYDWSKRLKYKRGIVDV